jgi:exosome complex exonuclease RRP6
LWLQQDFNIFVVGLFDTFHASKLLEFPKHSLAYLLETYCGFVPDKRYQLADWRIRPLPAEMSTYARSDTHSLLYIYDMLRLSLIERRSTDPAITDEADPKQTQHGRGLIHGVLSRSARTALRLYESEVYDAEGGTGSSGWDTLARKWNKVGLVGSLAQVRGMEVQGSQAAVYKAVHRWREDMARDEDESTRYVLPTHHLFLLAERVPTTVPDLLSLFGGHGGVNGSVPPVLKRRTGELVAVIKGAMEVTKSASGSQGPAADGREGAKLVVSTAVGGSEVMNSTAPSSAAKLTNESRLWTVTPLSTSAATISISHSSLFGIGISGERAQKKGVSPPSSADGEKAYSATGSVLFGSALTEVSFVA